MKTPGQRKIYQDQLTNKANNMTPEQLVKKIKTLKTRGIERYIYENALISNIGIEEAQNMLKNN
jgi:collagenase-like PrtC family protease